MIGTSQFFLRKNRALWLLIVAIAIFPFLLKTGIDSEILKEQATLSLYRSWRFSEGAREFRSDTPLKFERQHEKNPFEDAFQKQLARDFRLVAIGETARVRAFFASDTILSARIETTHVEASTTQVWEGSQRYVNNGILFGAWIGLLLWFLGRTYRTAGIVSVFVSLLWYAEWNLLDIPGAMLGFGAEFVNEIRLRFSFEDWNAGELGRLGELGAVLWTLLSLLIFKLVVRPLRARDIRNVAILSILVEPFFIYMGSRFGNWGSDASWWKVYLGSLCFRFVTFSHLFYGLLRPELFKLRERMPGAHRQNTLSHRSLSWSIIILPVVFVAVGGWEWLHSVLTPSSGDTILRLKVFLIGAVLGFILGSRVFAMWMGLMVVSLVLQPTKGHWLAAGYFGVILDSLFLGWMLTPYKGMSTLFVGPRMASQRSHFAILTILGWLLGTVFSSVGAPLGICWVALALAVWAYAQLTSSAQARLSNA